MLIKCKTIKINLELLLEVLSSNWNTFRIFRVQLQNVASLNHRGHCCSGKIDFFYNQTVCTGGGQLTNPVQQPPDTPPPHRCLVKTLQTWSDM